MSGFKIQRNSSERLILTEDSCEKALKITTDFSNWKKSSDGINGCEPKGLRYKPNSRSCSVDVTDCLPEHVQKYQGLTPEIAGPNCWNTALVMAKMLPNHRYTSESEFSYYMRPPLCRALKNNEARRAGDIGTVRKIENGQLEDEHAFVYVNSQTTFSKNGWDEKFPYQFQSFKAMSKEYGVSNRSECSANRDNPNCVVSTAYFRCQSMDEYLSQHAKIPSELLEMFHKADNFDASVETFVMKKSDLNSEVIQNLKKTGAVLVKYMKDQQKKIPKPPANSEEAFMLGALQARLHSVAEQLDIIISNPELNKDLAGLAQTNPKSSPETKAPKVKIKSD